MNGTQPAETYAIESSEIARLFCSDPREFMTQIYPLRQPAVMSGLLSSWPAARKWSPQYFKERFGATPAKVLTQLPARGPSYAYAAEKFTRTMTLGDFIDYMMSSDDICYYRRQHTERTAGVAEDLGFSALTPGMASTDFLWIGSANTRTGLHFDFQDNVLCQLYGDKDVYLVAPQDSRHLTPYADSITKSPVETDFPDPAKHPGIRSVRFLRTTLRAGEVLFIPKLWWHSVRSLSVSISVSHEFGQKISWGEMASIVNAAGFSAWGIVGRDFVKYGLLGRPHIRKLGDDPPFGQLAYEMMASALKRRWRKTA